MSFLSEIDAEAKNAGLVRAVAVGDTPPIFDWLLTNFSYQGISDRVARDYIEKHGFATWSDMQARLRRPPSCPKLSSYWAYEACRYDKSSFTCSEPDHIYACPVPAPRLRNGRLNQTAFSLFLFIRDFAGNDLVGWVDDRLMAATGASKSDLDAARQEAIIGPLREIYGISDKILTMTLSTLLIAARRERPVWYQTGKSMIAIDTLVHNFLHRTGILHDCGMLHGYGAACYRKGGCAEIIRTISDLIDARTINPTFPAHFPRFLQNSIWRFCAEDGLRMCNGNRIDDRKACKISYCQLHENCRREPLKPIYIHML
jgi:hypothetical protein